MAVWISVTTEALGGDISHENPGHNVRRPLRGIQVKPDTYACLRVITSTGDDLPFLDSGSEFYEGTGGLGASTHYYNFMIQDVQDQRAEKSQIVETFGEDYIYFFGERPRFLNVTGVLMNTKDFNWKNEFWTNYDRRLRGTKLVEQDARLYFYFDDVVVEGFMMGASTTYSSSNPYMLPLQFQIFVTNYIELSEVGSVYFQREEFAGPEGNQLSGLPAPTESSQQEAAQQAAQMGTDGGLNSFLAEAGKFANNASFAIQNTLENIRNTFYGRNLVVPQGLGASVYQAPLGNQATFEEAPRNRPIHEMADEYVKRAPIAAVYDQNEINRINEARGLATPEELENKAKAELERVGVDTSRREVSYALLGRGAFAAAQTMASFAITSASGELNE